jgi:Leucine-rich repeat (LRR) protein
MPKQAAKAERYGYIQLGALRTALWVYSLNLTSHTSLPMCASLPHFPCRKVLQPLKGGNNTASGKQAQRDAMAKQPRAPPLGFDLLLRVLLESGAPLPTLLQLNHQIHDALLLHNIPAPLPSSSDTPATCSAITDGREPGNHRQGNSPEHPTGQSRALVLNIKVHTPALVRLGKKRFQWLATQQQLQDKHRGKQASARQRPQPERREVKLVLDAAQDWTAPIQPADPRWESLFDTDLHTRTLCSILKKSQPAVTSLHICVENDLTLGDIIPLLCWTQLRSLSLHENQKIPFLDLQCLAPKWLPALRNLSICGWWRMYGVDGIPSGLTSLTIENNTRLESLDVSKLHQLHCLSCQDNMLTTLAGLTACSHLTRLECNNNGLAELSLGHLRSLKVAQVEQHLEDYDGPCRLDLPVGAAMDELSIHFTAEDRAPAPLHSLGSIHWLTLCRAFATSSVDLRGLARLNIHTLTLWSVSLGGVPTRWSAPGPRLLPSLRALHLAEWSSLAALNASPATGLTRLELSDIVELEEVVDVPSGLKEMACRYQLSRAPP